MRATLCLAAVPLRQFEIPNSQFQLRTLKSVWNRLHRIRYCYQFQELAKAANGQVDMNLMKRFQLSPIEFYKSQVRTFMESQPIFIGGGK